MNAMTVRIVRNGRRAAVPLGIVLAAAAACGAPSALAQGQTPAAVAVGCGGPAPAEAVLQPGDPPAQFQIDRSCWCGDPQTLPTTGAMVSFFSAHVQNVAASGKSFAQLEQAVQAQNPAAYFGPFIGQAWNGLTIDPPAGGQLAVTRTCVTEASLLGFMQGLYVYHRTLLATAPTSQAIQSNSTPPGSLGIQQYGGVPTATGVPGNPLGATGVPGNPLGATGVPGNPLGATGVPGNPIAGSGVPGNPIAGSGVPGNPIAGSGVPGNPIAGSGVPGNPIAGSGVPGNPIAGSGVPGRPTGIRCEDDECLRRTGQIP